MGKRQIKDDSPEADQDWATTDHPNGIMRSSTDWIPERELEMIVRQFYARKGITIPSDGVKLGKDDTGMIFCTVEAPQQPFAFKTRQRKPKATN